MKSAIFIPPLPPPQGGNKSEKFLYIPPLKGVRPARHRSRPKEAVSTAQGVRSGEAGVENDPYFSPGSLRRAAKAGSGKGFPSL